MGVEWFFHATAIADGSGDIAVGTTVLSFRLAPGHGSRLAHVPHPAGVERLVTQPGPA